MNSLELIVRISLGYTRQCSCNLIMATAVPVYDIGFRPLYVSQIGAWGNFGSALLAGSASAPIALGGFVSSGLII